MIKKIVVLFFLFILIISIHTRDKIGQDEKLFFYIPTKEEIINYFDLIDILNEYDENKIIITDDELLNYYKQYVGNNSLEGLLFEAFLRQTKNKNIKNQVLKIIENNNFNDVFSKILVRLYSSEEKLIKVDENKISYSYLQYNFKDLYFDENINLYKQSEAYIFDKELGLMIFNNSWNQLNMKNKKNDKNRESSIMFCGGGTNTLLVILERYNQITFKKFKDEVINEQTNYKRYKDWNLQEIELKNYFEYSGADKIYIGYGINQNNIDSNINEGSFNIYLYNKKLKKGYSVVFYMNISHNNNNYEMRNRIWNHLLMQLVFVFIDII